MLVVSTGHPRREIDEFAKPASASGESLQRTNQAPVVVNNSGLKVSVATAAFIFCLLLAGCSDEISGSVKTCEVVGKVLLDGSPLADAKVVFLPDQLERDSSFYSLAFGVTDDKGRFTLQRVGNGFKKVNQLAHGRYRVMITKLVDGREVLPERFHLSSELTYDLHTEESFVRPEFDLSTSGVR